jgi:hypothetical protein
LIFAERDLKLEQARERRKEKRQAAVVGQPGNATPDNPKANFQFTLN